MSDTHTVSAVNGVPGNVGAGVTGSNGGTFTIAANGSYTFNPGAAFDDLAVGQTRTTSVTYTNLEQRRQRQQHPDDHRHRRQRRPRFSAFSRNAQAAGKQLFAAAEFIRKSPPVIGWNNNASE